MPEFSLETRAGHVKYRRNFTIRAINPRPAAPEFFSRGRVGWSGPMAASGISLGLFV
jgi:hypothetical protein